MSKLYDLQEVVEETGLPERTVRYYLAKVLGAPSGTRGRKSYYDQVTVDQLMLAQQILMRDYDPQRGEVKPTLSEFRAWIGSLSEDEVKELVEMPYRIKPKTLLNPSNKQAMESSVYSSASKAPEKQASFDPMGSLKSMSTTDKLNFLTETQEKTGNYKTDSDDTAAQYLDRVMGPRRPHQQSRWQTHDFGPELQIRTRKPLSPEQQKQLMLTGQLLQSVLEG